MIVHIALRNVFRNKSRLLLSTLIVAIASLLLVFATGQIAGVDKTLRTSMINTLTGHIQVKPKAVPVDFFEASLGRLRHYIQADDIHQLLVKVRAVEGVEAVAPRLRFGALVGDEKGSTGTMIMAVDPIAEKRVSPDLSSMLDVIEQNSQAAFISEELSEKTNLGIGDEILVLAETPEEIPNGRPYDISGFSTAPILIDEYMKGIFLIDLTSARGLMYGNNMGDDSGITSEIAIRVKAEYVDQLPKVIERIEATLSKEEKEFLGVYSYRELAKAVGNVSNIAKSMAALQIGAVMFVMLVIVLIITKMGLHERRGEIGTLMSIGMARGPLISLFLLEVVIKVLIGYVAGLVIAVFLLFQLKQAGGMKSVTLVEQFMNGGKVMLPVIDVENILIGFFVVILVSMLTTLITCWNAASEDAVELLRSTG